MKMSKWKLKGRITSSTKHKYNQKASQIRQKIFVISTSILAAMFLIVVWGTRVTVSIHDEGQMSDLSGRIITDVLLDNKKNIITDFQYGERFFVFEEKNDSISKVFSNLSNSDELKVLDIYKSVKNDSGKVDRFYYQAHHGDRNIIVFIDMSNIEESKNNTTLMIGVISIACFIIVTTIISVASNAVIVPFVKSSEQQKQFITDASHDLKTPLTIISSNADVLEMTTGKNKWTTAIKNETKRMAELIDDMLTLSKVESLTERQERTDVNISEILNNMCDEFDSLWDEKNIRVIKNISQNIIVKANIKQIHRLFYVIMQNATKYGEKGGVFKLTVQKNKKTKNKLIVKMYNDIDQNENADLDKIFERFYRHDSSRNSSIKGHGIGLSIAKKICELEGYDISAAYEKKGICFTVVIN